MKQAPHHSPNPQQQTGAIKLANHHRQAGLAERVALIIAQREEAEHALAMGQAAGAAGVMAAAEPPGAYTPLPTLKVGRQARSGSCLGGRAPAEPLHPCR